MKLSEIFKNINNDNNYLVVSTNLKKEIIRAKSEFEINNKYLLDFKVITDNELIDLLSFKVNIEAYLYNLEYNRLEMSLTKEIFNFSRYNLNTKNNELFTFINNNKKFLEYNELFIDNSSNYNFFQQL